MKGIDRLQEYENVEFDKIILDIRNGKIKTGKYSKLVKVDKNYKLKGKEFFNNKTN